MKQTKSRRILALLLSLVMFVSLLPLQAFSEAELTEQMETNMEQTTETDVSDETTESDDPVADEDEQTDENPVNEEGDGDYEEPYEESAPAVSDESESDEPDEPAEETVDESEQQEEQDTQPVDDPLLQEPTDDLTKEPADENAEQETLPETEPTEELPVDEEAEVDAQMAVADRIAAYGHVYATALDAAMVYADSAMLEEQHIFTISQAGALLLATAYVSEANAVKVWFIASDGEILTGYVRADMLSQIPVTDEQADEMANILWFDYADSEAGTLLVFVVAGEKPTAQEEQPTEEPVMDDSLPAEPNEEAEVPETEAHAAAIGDFLYVTTQTRVFMGVDDTATDDYYGDYFLGYFLRDAAVQVEDVLEDSFGRAWYGISYVFGPDEGDGLICELIGHVYVLADETAQTDLTWRTATDYGYPPDYMRPMLLANYYYDLVDHYGGVASFYVGESGIHATTGHDNEYLPIARHDEYGTIFATPHYLKGETAYCLEHTQNSPVVRDHDSGPYTIVDLAGYKVTPGHSGYIFSDKTMHALAWVLRHTYPFMVLDRSDADNEVWCRVAGQFAMREVIKQIEGDFYVMDYWEMDEFYRAYDHAPGVYLDYARWLAAEALDYIENFGNITVADKSVRASGGQYIGTATLYTSTGEMRISKSVGTVTGNSGGSDGSYYYLYSGDTISVTSSKNKFSVPIEIMPSSDDEAYFYVAVTDADIQKLFLPAYGDPYPYQAASLEFEVPHGAASVTKKDAVSGSGLSGAVFELLNSGGSVLQTQTTGAGGTATFSNLTPGTYTIREKTAPQGYLNSSPNTQTVTVTAGNTASVTFTNNRKTSKIRIQKTDQLTGQALAGAEFTITRLSAPAGSSGVGSVAAVITTDANGAAETGGLEWGRFRITETKAPEDYEDSGYSVEIEAYENGKTYTFNVQNQPIPGYIQLTKTDANRGTPLSGVQFDIYYNDAYGSGLAGTMTTDADGVARSGALRKGMYQVKEHANPEGYTGELVTLDAIVRSDETTYLSAANQPIQGKIRIQKSDQLTGEALAGAEFTITRLSSSSAAGGAGVGETVILTTDENGVAETGWLDYGSYEVRETEVPVHFVDNSFSQQIAVFEHEKTYTLEVENEPTKGYIQIVKTDALDQTPVEGVQFDIYYNDEYGEGLAATMTTNADGVAVSEPIRKGKYIVREHANPTGYVSELVELDAQVRSDETTYLSASNQPIQGQIRIVKKDELTKEALAGAEFTITRISGLPSHKGAGDGDVVAVMTTDANGIALSPLLTWGTYLVEETIVPVHFVDNDYSTEVTIETENLQTIEIEVENEPTKGFIRLEKTDRLNGNPIEGVKFDIYYNDQYGEGLAASMVTDANGVALSEPIRKGRYIVKENGATVGYFFEEVTLDATVKSDETTELEATNVLYYGLNASSSNLIMVDRKKLKNPNGLILGTPGSGKSFAAKREIANCFLVTLDDIIICDPEGEYYALVQRLHGQVIRVSPTSGDYINPMDISLVNMDKDDVLRLKSDFILSMCELLVGNRTGIKAFDRSVIDRTIPKVYEKYFADPKPENMPTLGDLHHVLLEQHEREAHRIATVLEIYVTGSLNVFNHQTNVDIHNRLVCYDIKDLGKQLKRLGMLIVQDQVWSRVAANRQEGKATRYYMDEFHMLLKEEQTAAYSVEIWKRFRKWGGVPTGITQNVKDLLASYEVQNIFENSDFIYMLNQATGDREILAKQLGISKYQLSHVTQSAEGNGLLFYGDVIIPFVDRFPMDTQLYRIMTTKPSEISAAG